MVVGWGDRFVGVVVVVGGGVVVVVVILLVVVMVESVGLLREGVVGRPIE